MQCVLLAGGLGTRLAPVTTSVPKAMVEVAGAPFAHHQLELLAAAGVDRVVYCIGYLGDIVVDYVGDGGIWGLQVAYSDEGSELRGTGGALRLALDEGLLDERFFVMYGDSYLPVAMEPIWRAFAERPGCGALMTVLRNEGRWDASNVEYADGTVVRYDKNPRAGEGGPMDYIDYGLSAMERDLVADEIAVGTVVDLADVFHHLSLTGRLAGYEVHERFYEVGSAAGLRDLETHLAGCSGSEQLGSRSANPG